MFISIDEKALSWFTNEFEFGKPFSIRMFPQYAGFGEKHKGYTLGFSAETPTNAIYKQVVNGITFYFEENDEWFFNDTDTFFTIDNNDELQISFKETVIN
jgi:uncharacterized protein YneR